VKTRPGKLVKSRDVATSVDQRSGALLSVIREIWEAARSQASRSVNSALVQANWLIGKQIVEAEQGGKTRASYNRGLLKTLSAALEKEYGSGFSVSALQYMRAFFLGYPDLLAIQHAMRVESGGPGTRSGKQHAPRVNSLPPSETTWSPGHLHPGLAWTHYRTLLKVDQQEAREFYETEAVRNNWSARQLERQINSLLFFRLLKSRDKKGLRALANEGQQLIAPVDVIKDPYVLEFLDLPESHRLVETKLEEALISKLQEFLMELGSGFAFIGRQRRITLEGDHFYPDLIFYHTRLKCYVVVDLKVEKLTHGDLGQMQLYVHYYDREIAADDDNPTLGLILCTGKNDAVVRYVLDEKNKQIFASNYQFHLPTEEQLRKELEREIKLLGVGAGPSSGGKKNKKR
jgi:predicted nuclease of restriction endonuclease-like (RecB) superfamily